MPLLVPPPSHPWEKILDMCMATRSQWALMNRDIVLGASATGSEEEVNTYLSLYNFCTHFNLLYNLSPFNMFNLVVNSYLINLHRYRITTIDNFSQGTYLSQQQQYLHGLLISRQVCIGPGKKKTRKGHNSCKIALRKQT